MSKDFSLAPIKGKKPIISWEAVADLKIDEAYQRAVDSPASERLIRQIACNWDWGLCSVLLVSDRGDDGLYVVDGQHRLAACKLRTDIPHLPCLTAAHSSRKQEAALFVTINTARKTVTPLDRFHARCLAGDQEALALADLVSRAGLIVGKSPWSIHANEVCCVAVMARLLKQYGAKILNCALVNMAEAWAGEPMRVANEMLPGLCLIHLGNYSQVDPDLLASVLASRPQTGWFMGAASRQNEDPDAEWPDEVFRDIILARYDELAPKLKAA